MRRTICCVAVLMLTATGCGRDPADKPGALEAAFTPSGKRVTLRTVPAAQGRQQVRLHVVTTKDRNTLALVPVRINGRGPFAFAVDTGASKSLIDTDLARKLDLHFGDDAGTLQGIAGSGRGREVEVSRWRIGNLTLRPETIVSIDLGGEDEDDVGIVGLLGSDVLSRYGRVTIDYDHDILTLDPRSRKSR